MLSQYVIAERVGTGVDSTIRVHGLPLDAYGQPCDITSFPWEYDRMNFYMWIHKGPDTTQDYIVEDRCDIPGTITVLQTSTYDLGSADEIKQLEKNFYSYQTTHKHLFKDPKFNGAFTSYVVDGTFYDMFVVKFKAPELYTWASYGQMDETVIIAVPTGSGASTAIATIMTAAYGTPKNYSPTAISTTTTTSTTTV